MSKDCTKCHGEQQKIAWGWQQKYVDCPKCKGNPYQDLQEQIHAKHELVAAIERAIRLVGRDETIDVTLRALHTDLQTR